MKPVTYSWIGLSAAAPLVFLASVWALGVFHSFRRLWRSVDLFLLALFAQELLGALQAFVYALLSLMKPPTEDAVCGVFVWGFSATRTLQVATVASLLADRALTCQWPYRYRFSVRRHQVRYHLVVLAAMASLVGVAALLARSPPGPEAETGGFEDCRFLPHNLHVRLALFLLALNGLLLAVAAVSVGVVQATRGCHPPRGPSQPLDMTPITHGTTGSSNTSASSARCGPLHGGSRHLHPVASSASTSSSSSGGLGGSSGLQSASSTADLVVSPIRHTRREGHPSVRPLSSTPSADFRWSGSLAVAGVCLFVNQLPYTGLLVIGTFFPDVLPQWPMENLSLWLSLLQGLLLPLVLGLSDPTFAEAALLSCSKETPRHRSIPRHQGGMLGVGLGAGVGVRAAGGREEPSKAFPLTNGSLFPSLLSINVHSQLYNRPKGHLPAVTRMGVNPLEYRDERCLVPTGVLDTGALHETRLRGPFAHQQFYYNPDEPPPTRESLYAHSRPKMRSPEGSLGVSEEDPIYATLSDGIESYSSSSDEYPSLGTDGHPRCSSATTAADDDFEFHSPRGTLPPSFMGTCNLPLTISEDLTAQEGYSSSSSSSSFRSGSSTDSSPGEGESCENIATHVSPHVAHQETNQEIHQVASDLGFVNSAFEGDTPECGPYTSSRDSLEVQDDLSGTCSQSSEGTLTRRHRSSSLSMNDLDRLDTRRGRIPGECGEEEMMFILPVRSESMLSLYRLYLAEEDVPGGGTSLHYSLEASKSEGDLSVLSAGGRVPGGQDRCGHVQEIYQKKRVPMSAGSRIRRQHKIQRAKHLQTRTRPTIPVHGVTPFYPGGSTPTLIEMNTEEEGSGDCPGPRGVQLAVLNRAQRQNGIITIRDPSGLSVEELFRVLNRASSSGAGDPPGRVLGADGGCDPTTKASNAYPTTEYKKIFVSEYI